MDLVLNNKYSRIIVHKKKKIHRYVIALADREGKCICNYLNKYRENMDYI